jgi:hypothetical protein
MASFNKFAKAYSLNYNISFSQALQNQHCKDSYNEFLRSVDQLQKQATTPAETNRPENGEEKTKLKRKPKKVVYISSSDSSDSEEIEYVRRKPSSKSRNRDKSPPTSKQKPNRDKYRGYK